MGTVSILEKYRGKNIGFGIRQTRTQIPDPPLPSWRILGMWWISFSWLIYLICKRFPSHKLAARMGGLLRIMYPAHRWFAPPLFFLKSGVNGISSCRSLCVSACACTWARLCGEVEGTELCVRFGVTTSCLPSLCIPPLTEQLFFLSHKELPFSLWNAWLQGQVPTMGDIIHFPKVLRATHFHRSWLGWLESSRVTCSHWVQAICALSERMQSLGGCAKLSQGQQAGGLLSAPEGWGDKSGVCSSIFLLILLMFSDPIWSVTHPAGWAGGGPAGVRFSLMSLMSRVRCLQWKVHRLCRLMHLGQSLALPCSCCVTPDKSICWLVGLSSLIYKMDS